MTLIYINSDKIIISNAYHVYFSVLEMRTLIIEFTGSLRPDMEIALSAYFIS